MVSGKLSGNDTKTKTNALIKPNSNVKPKYRNERQENDSEEIADLPATSRSRVRDGNGKKIKMEIALISPSSTSMRSDNKTTPLLYTKTSRMADRIRRDKEEAANAIAELEDNGESKSTTRTSGKSRAHERGGFKTPENYDGTFISDIVKDMYVNFDELINSEIDSSVSAEDIITPNDHKSNLFSSSNDRKNKSSDSSTRTASRNTSATVDKNVKKANSSKSESPKSAASGLNFGNSRMSSVLFNSPLASYTNSLSNAGAANTLLNSSVNMTNSHSQISPTPSSIASYKSSRNPSPVVVEHLNSTQVKKNFFRNSATTKPDSQNTEKTSNMTPKTSSDTIKPNFFTPTPSSPLNDDSDYISTNFTPSPSTYTTSASSPSCSCDNMQRHAKVFTPAPSAFTPHPSKCYAIQADAVDNVMDTPGSTAVSSVNCSSVNCSTPMAVYTPTPSAFTPSPSTIGYRAAGVSGASEGEVDTPTNGDDVPANHAPSSASTINSSFNSTFASSAGSPVQRNAQFNAITKSWNFSTNGTPDSKNIAGNSLNNLISGVPNSAANPKAQQSSVANRNPILNSAALIRLSSSNNPTTPATSRAASANPSSTISHPISRNSSADQRNLSPSSSSKDQPRNANPSTLNKKMQAPPPYNHASNVGGVSSPADSTSPRSTKFFGKSDRRSDVKTENKQANNKDNGDDQEDEDGDNGVEEVKTRSNNYSRQAAVAAVASPRASTDSSLTKNRVQSNVRPTLISVKKTSGSANSSNRQVNGSTSKSKDSYRKN